MKILNNEINNYVNELKVKNTMLLALIELKVKYNNDPLGTIDKLGALYTGNADVVSKTIELSKALQGIYTKDKAFVLGSRLISTRIKYSVEKINDIKSNIDKYYKETYSNLQNTINNYDADYKNLKTLIDMGGGDKVKVSYFSSKAFDILNVIPGEVHSQKTVYGYLSVINKITNLFNCPIKSFTKKVNSANNKLKQQDIAVNSKLDITTLDVLDITTYDNINIMQEDISKILNSVDTDITAGDKNTIYDKISNETLQLNKYGNNIITCLRNIKKAKNDVDALGSYGNDITMVADILNSYDKEEITAGALEEKMLMLSLVIKNKFNVLVDYLNTLNTTYIEIDDNINRYDAILTMFTEIASKSIINKASINDLASEQ